MVQAMREGVGVPAEATDRFPPFLSVRGDAVVPLDEDFGLGFEGGYSSTGGRVDYRDATGSYRYDQLVRRVYVGAYTEVGVVERGRLAVSGTLRHRLSAGRIEFDEALVVGGQTLAEGGDALDQLSFSLQPEVAASVGAGPIQLRAHAGWEQTLAGGLHQGSRPVSIDGDGADRINWSGPRLGLGLALRVGG